MHVTTKIHKVIRNIVDKKIVMRKPSSRSFVLNVVLEKSTLSFLSMGFVREYLSIENLFHPHNIGLL